MRILTKSRIILSVIVSISALLLLPHMVLAGDNVALGKKGIKIGCDAQDDSQKNVIK